MTKMIAAVMLLVASVASADDKKKDDKKPAGPPQPGAEMSELKKFAGTWTCNGKGTDPMTKAAQTYTSKISIDTPKELNGFWMHLKFDQGKPKEGGSPFFGDAMLGFDTVSNKYYMNGVDSFGGWILVVGTLNGGTLELSGNANVGGHTAPIKFVFTAADKKLSLNIDIGGTNVDADDCKK